MDVLSLMKNLYLDVQYIIFVMIGRGYSMHTTALLSECKSANCQTQPFFGMIKAGDAHIWKPHMA